MAAAVIVVLSGCDLFKSDDGGDKEYSVTYRVFGTHQSKTKIIYKDENGTDQTISIDNPPWQYSFTAMSGTPVAVYAKKETAGIASQRLEVAIDLNGDTWKSSWCTTSYCSISDDWILP